MCCIVASPPPKCYSAAKPPLQPAILISGSALPSFEGDFDPHAYIDWELKVEAEFDKYELSDHQMILAAASALTEHALVKWKYIYIGITIFHKLGQISKCTSEMPIFLHIILTICLANYRN